MKGTVNAQTNHFSAAISGGPNFYFNNIKTFKDNVRPFNYSFFARVMWNSKYAVSLGLETGYNRYYRVNGFSDANIRSSLTAIPFHLVIGMRVTKAFYTNLSFGPSLLLNAARTSTDAVNNKVFSFADGSLAVGYKRKLNEKFNIGAELKFNFSTKAEDLNITLPIVLSYRF